VGVSPSKYDACEPTRRCHHHRGAPLVAFSWAPEFLARRASTVLVECSRLDLSRSSRSSRLRVGADGVIHRCPPLLPFASRSESSRECLPPDPCAWTLEPCHRRFGTAGCRHPAIQLSSRRSARRVSGPLGRSSSGAFRHARCAHRTRLPSPFQISPTFRRGRRRRAVSILGRIPSLRVGRARERRASRELPGSPRMRVGPCVASPPRGGIAGRTSVASRRAATRTIASSRCRGAGPIPEGTARLLVSRPRVVQDVSPFQELANRRHRGSPGAGSESSRLPWGLWALRRLRRRAATHAGVASPSYAASSGFLNPSTLCSAHLLSGLVSCR
jgi:hypothetical protein